ncbi:MAG TPA: hypothetical protein VGO25_03510 [Rhodanobacteraceae bacterium]|jgi:hypothetical protein|nr:hypothetical protein [Rhodanobacteraceae bacterium]
MRNQFVCAVVSTLLPLLFSPVALSAPPSTGGQGIGLTVTLGSDTSDGACGTDGTLQATQGDSINFCYVATNNSTIPLTYQTLADDVVGPILTDVAVTIAPGASYQYNRIVTAMASQSPTSTWTAYDERPDYVFSNNVTNPDTIFADGFDANALQYAFVDITGSGTNLQLNDDDYIVTGIGFPFTFYGHTADHITVSNNGGMLFDQGTGINGRLDYLSPANRVLPDRMIGPAILPYWEDLQQDYIDGIGNVFVQTLGTAPNRRFVIEWYNLPVNVIGGGNTITFEAILIEGSNNILFQYSDTDCSNDLCDNGVSATIGLNSDATHATQYSFDQASVGAGTAILFQPTTPTTYSATQQVTLDVGAPVIGVDPTSFDKTVAAGASTTDTMTIANTGNRDLTWNIGAVNPRAHFPPTSRFALPVGDPAQTRIGPRPRVGSAKSSGSHPQGTIGVPAFAAELQNSELVSMDASAPASVTDVASLNGLTLLAGDFKGEDFSTLYAIDFLSFNLYKVDTMTGAVTLVYLAVPPPGAQADAWNGMAWDQTTNTMFAVTSAGRTPTTYLSTIDPDTAETTFIGPITGVGDPVAGAVVVDIAVRADGLMFGVEIVTDTLVAIDKTTGEAQTLGSIGFDANFAEGLDFDDTTNTLYFAAIDNGTGAAEMYTLDTDTGAGTLISPISPDPTGTQYSALGIARLTGICAYPESVPWLSYSSARGSTVPGATTPITVTFDATNLTQGDYSADICINNNDLTNRRLPVPVTLTVQ